MDMGLFTLWTFTVLTLLGIGHNLAMIDKPREPLTPGIFFFNTAISVFWLVGFWRWV